jgi:hypothetical protein
MVLFPIRPVDLVRFMLPALPENVLTKYRPQTERCAGNDFSPALFQHLHAKVLALLNDEFRGRQSHVKDIVRNSVIHDSGEQQGACTCD